MENFEFQTEKIEKAAELLKAVAHQLRLKILRGVDVVQTRRDGKKIYYKLNYDRLSAMNRGIDLFEEFTAARKVAAKKKK